MTNYINEPKVNENKTCNFNYFCSFRMIDGVETLDDLEKVPVNDKNYRPLQDIYLRRVTIHANPLAN